MTAHEYEDAAARAVKASRLSAGMTQRQLAKSLGVARPRITELEAGTKSFRLRTLYQLAQAFGTTPGALLDTLTAEEC